MGEDVDTRSEEADGRHCGDLARAGDRERWLCALFAPEPARRDLWALLAFNLEIARTREVVSEPALGEIRLQWWRDALDEARRGVPREHPVARGLTTAIARTGLSRERFEALLHGRGHDLYDDPIPDMAALEAYADATSGELSVLAAEVLGARDPATLVAARSVGVAWGLVGVVRATAFLAARRRLLLPADRLVAHAVEAESVFLGRPGGGLANVVEEVVRRAEHRLGEARAARPTVARRAIPALLPAMIARRHVARLRRDRFAVFGAAPGPAPLLPLALWWAATTGRY